MGARLTNLGYMALIKQTNPTTVLTPTDYVPYYKESMMTDLNLVEDNPVYGGKFKGYQILQGQRSHKGSFTCMAEPNTAARLFDMLLNKVSTSGAGPYTHTFGLNATDPNSYTMDFSTGNQVFRFWGVQASKISPAFQDNEMQFDVSVSALGSFFGRQIASIATNVLTLDTTYDPSPTIGLVANDLVAVTKSDGSLTTNFTVTSITATTVTLSATAAAFASGDTIILRPATPTLTLKTPFLWARTEFRLAVDASTALSAAHTPMEIGSAWTVEHMFESDEGAKRSGTFDPAALIRTLGDGSLKVKKFFDTVEDLQKWISITKRGIVIRHFSETGYELRITLNNCKIKSSPKPNGQSGSVLYAELEYATQYDNTDAAGMSAVVTNNLVTI